MTPRGLDRALDFAVLPGYTRLGFSLRRLGRTPAIEHGLGGRVVLVTGGSSGIGEAACLDLLAAGATVHLLGRDAGRTAAAVGRMRRAYPTRGTAWCRSFATCPSVER